MEKITVKEVEYLSFRLARETMSFNGKLGDVSEKTGYKQAYIIQDGKTILGDGGGVCQVSTTLFRAALDAGLPRLQERQDSPRKIL